jgi:hypothetical protein
MTTFMATSAAETFSNPGNVVQVTLTQAAASQEVLLDDSVTVAEDFAIMSFLFPEALFFPIAFVGFEAFVLAVADLTRSTRRSRSTYLTTLPWITAFHLLQYWWI